MYQLCYTTEPHKPSPWVDLENFLGGASETVGIKVSHLNVLLELQLRTSLVISQVPV